MGGGAVGNTLADGIGEFEDFAQEWAKKVTQNTCNQDSHRGQGGNTAILSRKDHTHCSGDGFRQQGCGNGLIQGKYPAESKNAHQAHQCSGGYTGENLVLAGTILTILGINVFFYGMIQFTNVVLQSHGYAHIPVINTLVCGSVRLAVVYVLVGNPQIGIVGAPIGMLLCYGAIGLMNLIAIAKVVPHRPKILKNLLRPALPAILMGVAVWGVSRVLTYLPFGGSRVIACGVPVAVGVVVYLVCVVIFKAIRKEDCLLLPKGEKISRILHL